MTIGSCPEKLTLYPLDRLLLMNDLINNVLDRYEACKKGDWAKAAEIDAT